MTMTVTDARPPAGLREAIDEGRTALGIELGSTRIKAVLTGPDHEAIAVGSHDWENQFVDRTWTYSLEAVWEGLQGTFAALAEDVRNRYGTELRSVGALGVSAMMHGYLAFDGEGELLTPFRTWRNTNTGDASEQLSELFGYNVPHRWSIAHLFQAVLNGEEHLGRIAHLTTLAGYVHWKLSGRQVLGVGDASGVFPIDVTTGGYDARMLAQFDELAAGRVPLKLADLLPAVLPAGEAAGTLTEAGARLLDPSGTLRPGATLCPPEGDAGTGMVATNSIARRTGNISAGTSIFAMIVLDGPLSRMHPEIDLVTTPAGDLVAMVHCNNGASELNSWAGLFTEFAAALGAPASSGQIFETLFKSALTGAADGGGLMAFNYLSGEPITKLHEGRPLFLREPGSSLTLGSFMRTQLYSALATLRIGMDVLQKAESVQLDSMFAHGGLFKTEGVAQKLLAAAINTPVSVGNLAAEGGAWGIAVLAGFVTARQPGQSLADFLNGSVFAGARLDTAAPEAEDVAGFNAFMQRYVAALPVEAAAVEHS
jgi:sugar (pentulose or hexulose) kinase